MPLSAQFACDSAWGLLFKFKFDPDRWSLWLAGSREQRPPDHPPEVPQAPLADTPLLLRPHMAHTRQVYLPPADKFFCKVSLLCMHMNPQCADSFVCLPAEPQSMDMAGVLAAGGDCGSANSGAATAGAECTAVLLKSVPRGVTCARRLAPRQIRVWQGNIFFGRMQSEAGFDGAFTEVKGSPDSTLDVSGLSQGHLTCLVRPQTHTPSNPSLAK